ncbi:MFS transporter [Kribbella solani]|uniref:MFS family permease n=1 Tax=Kribbella solani TaxID=236067 RepID=A0A841DUU4_9ACTN|nr:MFS transporter [Kribbella solani]MBB5980047.1 MFS family permease [Kribbella solani]
MMQDPGRPVGRTADGDRVLGGVVVMLCLTAGVMGALETVLVPALPLLQRELSFSPTDSALLVTLFTLSGAVATPMVGRLADIYGPIRVLRVVAAVTGLGGLLSAVGSTLTMLIVGQVLQGCGYGIFPLGLALLWRLNPGRAKVAVGLLVGSVGVGGGLGLVVSGLTADNLGRHLMFAIPTVVFLACVGGLLLVTPRQPIEPAVRRRGLDWLGLTLLAGPFIALNLVLNKGLRWGWGSWALLAYAGLGILGLLRIKGRRRDPFIDTALLRRRTVALVCLAALLTSVSTGMTFFLIPQLVSLPAGRGPGFGATVTEAGLYLAPFTMIGLMMGPIAGWLDDRWGTQRALVLAAMVAAGGFGALVVAHDQPWHLLVWLGVAGAGAAVSFTGQMNAVLAAVPTEQAGIATGLIQFTRGIGSVIGVQLAARVMARHLPPLTHRPDETGFVTGFVIAAGVFGVSALVVAGLRPRQARRFAAYHFLS